MAVVRWCGPASASMPADPYVSEVMDSTYQGGDRFQLDVNDLHVQIRYLVVITSS